MRSRSIYALVALALITSASPGRADSPSEASIAALIEATADSPAAHAALARFYAERAATERAKAKRMREAARHRVGKLGASAWTGARADPGRDNAAAAERYEQLAAMHETESHAMVPTRRDPAHL